MNKSIVKHELRSLKWIFALGLLMNVILISLFSVHLDSSYINIFNSDIAINKSVFNLAFSSIAILVLIGYLILCVLQVFVQFASEKKQEVSRFLKVLPITSNNFLITKLILGILNITILFLVFYLGLLFIKNSNMFWVEDIYRISNLEQYLTALDQIIYPLFMIYLQVLSFYTFLVMIQYSINNNIAAVIIGVLVWFAPVFIAASFKMFIEDIGINNNINFDSMIWLNPALYLLDSDFIHISGRSASYINNLNIKYIVLIIINFINIILSFKLSDTVLIENENSLIPMNFIKVIFVLGVTVCSGLLVSFININMLNLSLSIMSTLLLVLIGSILGFIISRKIAKIN